MGRYRTQVKTTIPVNYETALKNLAEKTGKTQAEIMRIAIVEYLGKVLSEITVNTPPEELNIVMLRQF